MQFLVDPLEAILLLIVCGSTNSSNSHQHISLATDILGGGFHDDVNAELGRESEHKLLKLPVTCDGYGH